LRRRAHRLCAGHDDILVIKQKFEFKPLVNEGAPSRGDEEIDVTLAQLTMQRPEPTLREAVGDHLTG
jgi:hypothetical protein